MKLNTIFLIIFLLLSVFQNLKAQSLDERRLNLYKPGKVKVLPYRVGDDLTFKMKDFDHYYTLEIIDLRNDSIVFTNGVVRLYQIETVQYPRNSTAFAANSAGSLYVFGGSWLVYTGIDELFGGQPNWTGAAIVAGTSGVLGFLISRLARPKTFKLNERFYLKIITP